MWVQSFWWIGDPYMKILLRSPFGYGRPCSCLYMNYILPYLQVVLNIREKSVSPLIISYQMNYLSFGMGRALCIFDPKSHHGGQGLLCHNLECVHHWDVTKPPGDGQSCVSILCTNENPTSHHIILHMSWKEISLNSRLFVWKHWGWGIG